MTDGRPENVLVLAPHPDDEVIGCGGTVIRHVANGSNVLVVYLTKGQGGVPGPEGESMAEQRREEARAGLHQMGCSDAVFLDFPDRELYLNARACSHALVDIMDRFKPTSVFVPFLIDEHPDHSATAWIFDRALGHADITPWCYLYEVWTTLVPNTVVDISNTMEQKMRALSEHKSQIQQFDYTKRVQGLNAFRSIYFDERIEYCEAFIKCQAAEYRRLVSKVKRKDFRTENMAPAASGRISYSDR